MDALLNHIPFDRLADLAQRQVLDQAMLSFYTFTLVLVRISGLMTVGPLFGQSVVPANIRVLLVLTMSFLIAPALHNHTQLAFTRLDADKNGRVTRDEIPKRMLSSYDRAAAASGRTPGEGLTSSAGRFPPQIPRTALDYAWIGIAEFALGFILGLGVHIILSGLQLAGHVIDQQTGIALGEVFNPAFEMEGSLSGQLLYFLGITVFLVMEPVNGHLQIVSALVETFQTLPVGGFGGPIAPVDALRDIIHQSFVLAIRVAAPVLAVMSLVALTMGFLGHTVPQINILIVGFPVRVLASLLILSVTMSGAADLVVESVPQVIQTVTEVLSLTG